MSLRNNELRYGTVAAAFHWVIAAVIIFQLWLGLYMGGLPHSDPNQFALVQLHKSVGLTILVLTVLRILWRFTSKVPPLPATMGPVLKALARTSHFLLYILMLAIPLSGWAMASASALGLPIRYFGLFDWPRIWFLADMTREERRPIGHTMGEVHEILAYSLIALLVIHISAALLHQFVYRDNVLRRMIPGAQLKEPA